jgi:hypothetical protein
MTSLALQDWLSLVSTVAIVMALAVLQSSPERVGERRARRGHEPAHLKHRNWR